MPSAQPPSLYEQAKAALAPHRDGLKLATDEQHALAAREIASQANGAGLTAISRIERATGGHGEPALVARMPGYARLAKAAEDNGVQIHVSPMSKTAAVNVGPGALSLAFAAKGHQAH